MITGSLNNWLRCFLRYRTQQSVCDGVPSPPQQVISGVLQGTVLGHLLFLLYVNDLPFGLECQTRLFADDCLIYMSVTSVADMDKLQSDLKKLELWQMEFNPEKCFIMCIFKKRNPPFREYTFCNTTLAYVEKHPYLGVTLDANLRWNHHLLVLR